MTVFRLWSDQPLGYASIDPQLQDGGVYITPVGERHYRIGTRSDWDALLLDDDGIEQLVSCIAQLREQPHWLEEAVPMPNGNAVRLVLPWPPSLNRMVRRSGARVHVSAEAHAYKEQAGRAARTQGISEALSGNLNVVVWLYRPARRGDLDNYLKVLLDSLSGIVWDDDDQITELHVYRRDDKARPRVELEVRHD